jgi:hypothetical protein
MAQLSSVDGCANAAPTQRQRSANAAVGSSSEDAPAVAIDGVAIEAVRA